MALTITTTITVADDEAYTAREQAILAAIAAHPAGKGLPATAAAEPGEIDMLAHTREAANARIAESKAKTAAEAKAKADAAAKTKAAADAKAAKAAAEAEAAEETKAAEEPEEDLVGDGADEATFTLEDAVAAATKLVSTGKGTVVKAALGAVGAKRVTDMKDAASINTFMAALEV